jgi:hypothetical protein
MEKDFVLLGGFIMSENFSLNGVLEKIDSGIELTENEIRGIVLTTSKLTNEYLGRDQISHKYIYRQVCQVRDRFFEITWVKDFLGTGKNEYKNQPVEVFRHKGYKLVDIEYFSKCESDSKVGTEYSREVYNNVDNCDLAYNIPSNIGDLLAQSDKFFDKQIEVVSCSDAIVIRPVEDRKNA